MLVLDVPSTEDNTTDLVASPGPLALAAVCACACPVVLVPDAFGPAAATARHATRVALGIDARHLADQAVAFAFDSTQVRGVRLHAVHAWGLPSHAAEFPFAIPEEDRATREDQEVRLPADVLRPRPRERGLEVP